VGCSGNKQKKNQKIRGYCRLICWCFNKKLAKTPSVDILITVGLCLNEGSSITADNSSYNSRFPHHNQVRYDLISYWQTVYLSIVQLGQSGTGIRQQEVPTEDGHLIPKLHVLQRAIGSCPLLQIYNPTMHQESSVDQLCDFCQIPLAMKQTNRWIKSLVLQRFSFRLWNTVLCKSFESHLISCNLLTFAAFSFIFSPVLVPDQFQRNSCLLSHLTLTYESFRLLTQGMNQCCIDT